MPVNLSAHLWMLLWAGLVASSFPVAAQFNPELSASLLVGIRFMLAGTIMWMFRPVRFEVRPAAFVIYSVLGVMLAGNFVIMFIALRTAEPLNLAALFISQPLFAYLIAWALKIEKLSLTRTLVLLCAASAALILLTRADLAQLSELQLGFGERIYIFACLLSAGYNVLSRHATDKAWIPAAPYTTTCISLVMGGLLISIPDLIYTDIPNFIALTGTTDLIALGYLTLFTSLGTFWILQSCALKLDPSMLAAYGYQAPLLYLIAELALGFTSWHPIYLVAAAMLLTSFYLLSRDGQHKKSRGT